MIHNNKATTKIQLHAKVTARISAAMFFSILSFRLRCRTQLKPPLSARCSVRLLPFECDCYFAVPTGQSFSLPCAVRERGPVTPHVSAAERPGPELFPGL